MSGFSADWLHLREPIDLRSRNARLAQSVKAYFKQQESIKILDLGCGTGANLRASYLLYPNRQQWILVDHDAELLKAAEATLIKWASKHQIIDGTLQLRKGRKHIHVRFQQADLAQDIERLITPDISLVTASALFDLTGKAWQQRLLTALQSHKIPLYTVLTYDGRDEYAPPHKYDGAISKAFKAHQMRDKGFGAATGPHSAASLANIALKNSYFIEQGDSPWLLRGSDRALIILLLHGVTSAVLEIDETTRGISAEQIKRWQNFRLKQHDDIKSLSLTGHTDLFLYP